MFNSSRRGMVFQIRQLQRLALRRIQERKVKNKELIYMKSIITPINPIINSIVSTPSGVDEKNLTSSSENTISKAYLEKTSCYVDIIPKDIDDEIRAIKLELANDETLRIKKDNLGYNFDNGSSGQLKMEKIKNDFIRIFPECNYDLHIVDKGNIPQENPHNSIDRSTAQNNSTRQSISIGNQTIGNQTMGTEQSSQLCDIDVITNKNETKDDTEQSTQHAILKNCPPRLYSADHNDNSKVDGDKKESDDSEDSEDSGEDSENSDISVESDDCESEDPSSEDSDISRGLVM